MARVSTVQFNGSNAYELLQGDFITSFPFETINYGDIALSVQVYSFTTTGKVRAKVKGFDDTGKMIVNVYQDFTPTQTNIWQILEATWEVPVEMVKGEVQLESITGTNLIAQPKAISGTSAGAYSTNYSQQLTFITQTGLYTGTVTAHQVILVDKDNLSNRLVTINNSLLSLQDREDKISTEITAYGAKISALETKEGILSSSITRISAGNLNLSSNTKGKIGSFTINSNYLVSSSPRYEVRLSADSSLNAFQVYDKSNKRLNFFIGHNGDLWARNADLTGKITATSGTIGGWNITKSFIDSVNGRARVYLASHADSADSFLGINDSNGVRQFSVSKQGHLVANSATIKGTLQAGSIVNGQLNNTTGTHTGSTTGTHSGSLYSVGGTYKGGLVNTTGTHTGYTTGQHSGSLYYTNGNHAGSLYQTTGSHNGSIYSSTGTLGGIPFSANTLTGRLSFRGGIGADGFFSTSSGIRVSGNIVYSGTLTHDSDERLKQDIEDIPQNIVDELMNVKIKRFGYKTNPNEKHFGVIAQDLIRDTSRDMSDTLVKPYEGYFAVAYEQFVPLLIKKVQDQEKRIKELEEKIA